MNRRAWSAATLAGVALVACSPPRDDPAAIAEDDQRQLNEAAAMLDANSLDANLANGHESSPHD